MTKKLNHIHFIGICGVAMSALALAFKKVGYKVTGSDVGFFPPISTYLDEQNVEYYPGWHPEKMGEPDLVVVGNVASSTNPEWLHVQEKNIPYQSYPEVIRDFIIKKNSIVCAGTYGKTTSTALLTAILQDANFDPSYMFGGLMQNSTPSATITAGDWSVVEGDEYKTARWDIGPKFAYYNPTHLLLTAVVWDHADVYKTEHLYEQAFQKLLTSLPRNSTCVVSEQVESLKLPKNTIRYGASKSATYQYLHITETKDGTNFTIKHNGSDYKITSPCLGTYMVDNITGCFALASELGIAPEISIASIKKFNGMKRRLEKRFSGKITVIDDIAHSPAKVQSVLRTLRSVYQNKIIAVFEPNTGNRRPEAIPSYDNAFDGADEVIIPRLTKIKLDQNDKARALEGDELTKVIGATHGNALYMPDDEALVTYLSQNQSPGNVVVFLGSHGFRGMIEKLIKKVSV